MKRRPIYGLLAEFESPEQVLEAARRTHDAGFKSIDAFTPIPVEGLAEAVGFEKTRLPLLVLIGGTLGGLTGFSMCYYANVISFPLNIGGQPVQQLAIVDPDHVRVDDPRRRAHRCLRHACAQRNADAVSSGLQRGAFRARFDRPVLSVHQGARQKIRSGEDESVSRKLESARSVRN